jgi:hypothetical protein
VYTFSGDSGPGVAKGQGVLAVTFLGIAGSVVAIAISYVKG